MGPVEIMEAITNVMTFLDEGLSVGGCSFCGFGPDPEEGPPAEHDETCICAELKKALKGTRELPEADTVHRPMELSRLAGVIRFARQTWDNDGAEGETIHKLCDELEERISLREKVEFVTFEGIQQAPEDLEIWSPDYKDDRPWDRLVIVSDGETGTVLDHIGPGIGHWMENVGIATGEFALPPGVWIAQVDFHTHYDAYNGDYDIEMVLNDERKPTKQEWEMIHEDVQMGPWKESDWLSNPQTDLPAEGPSDLPEGWEKWTKS